MEHDHRGSDDLRTRLHAMESKLSRIRTQRDSHNDSARSAADQRNSAHEKRKEVHETISAKMDEQKKVRAQAKLHQASRDEIQQSIREVIARKKGTRDRGPGKSVVIQLSETVGEIEDLFVKQRRAHLRRAQIKEDGRGKFSGEGQSTLSRLC